MNSTIQWAIGLEKQSEELFEKSQRLYVESLTLHPVNPDAASRSYRVGRCVEKLALAIRQVVKTLKEER